MSATAKISNGEVSVEYGIPAPAGSGVTRHLLTVEPGYALHETRIVRVPGVDGNYVLDMGRASGRLALRVLYHGGTVPDLCDAIDADIAAMCGGPVEIEIAQGSAKKTYSRCTLENVRAAPIEGGRAVLELEFAYGH